MSAGNCYGADEKGRAAQAAIDQMKGPFNWLRRKNKEGKEKKIDVGQAVGLNLTEYEKKKTFVRWQRHHNQRKATKKKTPWTRKAIANNHADLLIT